MKFLIALLIVSVSCQEGFSLTNSTTNSTVIGTGPQITNLTANATVNGTQTQVFQTIVNDLKSLFENITRDNNASIAILHKQNVTCSTLTKLKEYMIAANDGALNVTAALSNFPVGVVTNFTNQSAIEHQLKAVNHAGEKLAQGFSFASNLSSSLEAVLAGKQLIPTRHHHHHHHHFHHHHHGYHHHHHHGHKHGHHFWPTFKHQEKCVGLNASHHTMKKLVKFWHYEMHGAFHFTHCLNKAAAIINQTTHETDVHKAAADINEALAGLSGRRHWYHNRHHYGDHHNWHHIGRYHHGRHHHEVDHLEREHHEREHHHHPWHPIMY